MTHNGTMRRRRTFALKVIAVGFITLMLLRTDWLAAVFLSVNQSSRGLRRHFLPEDLVPGIEDADQQRESIIREMMEREKHLPACPIPHLKSKPAIQSNATTYCRRIQPFRSACKVAEELFGNPQQLDISQACGKRRHREYCRIIGAVDRRKVTCDISVCDKHMYLGIIDVTNGKLNWTSYRRNTDLQLSIQNQIGKANFGYCLLSCSESPPTGGQDEQDYDNILRDEDDFASFYGAEPQILNLPPLPPDSQLGVDDVKTFINFNFIFIDSVARHHFYRSLPRSVKKLDEIIAWNKENLLVLDFELVQGVRSRTFETLQTLFSGSVNPFEQPFGTQEMPREKLKIENLFVPLKGLGFNTLWLEDLCPYWEWGISKDMLVYNKTLSRETLYRKLLDTVKRSGIDNLGNTFSSCDILNANLVPDPFHAPDKLCYNGKHQHEYTLSYLEAYQRIMTKNSQPFISFFETNVGHEGTGKRIQYFDSAFSYYLDFAKDLTNTLTIVFSDHGNAYGEFLNRAAEEARIEIFHPLLFMIIPDKVKSFFTESQLHTLQLNQNRLVSILDLHYTMTYMIEQLHDGSKSRTQFHSEVSDFNKQFNVSRYGLLSEISSERTCSHMPRIMPNSCICEGYDVALSNKAYHYILAAYFVGMINNNIQKSELVGEKKKHHRVRKRKVRQFGGFGSCQRMKVKKIKNIQESKPNDYLKTAKMDLYVETDGQTVDEIFFISIQMDKDSGFSLSSFDRITPYSKYSKCVDADVDVKVCICKIQSENNSSKDPLEMLHSHNPVKRDSVEVGDILDSMLYSDLTHNITSITVYGEECLYIISQSNKAGLIYEAFNNCKASFKLRFSFHAVNLVLSSGNNVSVKMLPNDVTFVTAGVSETGSVWSCDLTVSFDI